MVFNHFAVYLHKTYAKKLTDSQVDVMRFMDSLPENAEPSIDEIASNHTICSEDAMRRAVYQLAKMDKLYRTNPGAQGGRGLLATYAKKKEKKENEIPFV